MRFQLSIFIDPLALGGHAVYQLRNTITLSACAVATAMLVSACGGGSASTANLTAQTVTASATPSSIVSSTGTSVISGAGGAGTGTFSYAIKSGSCTLAGATLTASSTAAPCVVTATKAADATYAAASADITVTVLTSQTITAVATPASIATGATSTLSTTGGTGSGTVTYQSTGGCTIVGTTLTAPSSAASCVVTATKAADAAYAGATSNVTVTVSATVTSTSPIDFETTGRGAAFAWSSFENAANAAAEIVTNPSKTGINTSDKVVKFTAVQAGQPWAGFQSAHSTDLGTVTLSTSNALVKMMVYKPVISDVGIKFASVSNASTGEIKVANTVTNAWELLTFNFCSRVGEVNDQIIFFPDFNARSADTTDYLDNVTFNACPSTPTASVPTTAPAVPTVLAANVASLYGDGYTTITGTDTPNWGQSTAVSAQTYASNNVLKLSNFSYQGVVTAAAQDVSTYTNLHIDFWSETATTIEVKLVSLSPTLETSLFIPVNAGTWTSKDILMSGFTAPNKAKFQQLILAAATNGAILYVDNIYFWK